MRVDEMWTMPSWRTALPLNAKDDRFRQLFADHGPAMNPGLVKEISSLYLEALLQTSVPSWMRARLIGEQRRRRRSTLSERLRLQARLLSAKYLRRRPGASAQQRSGIS